MVDFHDLLRQTREHLRVVDSLRRLAVPEGVFHLADEQNHRCRVLLRHVHAIRRMGDTGATGSETDAWSVGQLAVGIDHVRGDTLVTNDDGADAVGIIRRAKRRQVAFLGNAIDGIDGITLQCLCQDLPTVALGKGVGHEDLTAHVMAALIFGPERANAKRSFLVSSFLWRMNPRSSLRGRPLSVLRLEGTGLEYHRNGSFLGGSESAVFRSLLHLLLNYVYVIIFFSREDCSYIVYKFSLLVFPRVMLSGCFLRGRSLLGR